jgi:GNAT superfamily N-acetyltransferase
MHKVPSMNPQVFSMNRKHLAGVGALSNQLGYPVNLSALEARLEELSSLPHHGLFVIEDDGVKAWIHLEIVYDLIEEKKVEIKALVVDENERSKGHGHALILTAREWAKTYLLSTIYLSCNIIRDRAHAFYLREGFIKTKTSHFFELKI